MNLLSQWVWIVPVTLFILVIFQGIYLFWLTFAPRGSGRRAPRQPGAPIMPTSPENLMNTVPPNYGRPAAPRITEGKMLVISGLNSQKEIPLPGSNFAVGRFYNSERGVLVAFDEKSVSRQHATFSGDDIRHEYYLTDTNSSYGTAIQKNNRFELLTPGKRERIYNDDVVQFGNLITVRFALPGETRAAALHL